MSNPFLDSLVASPIPREACALWEGDAASMQLRKCHSRAVFRFEVDGEGCFLKLAWGDQATREAVRGCAADMHFVAFLAERGVAVNEPILSRNDRFLEMFQWRGQPVRARVTREVRGRMIADVCDQPGVFRICGEALGRMHAAASEYEPPWPGRIASWEDEWRETRKRIPKDARMLRDEYRRIDAWIAKRSPVGGGIGITHADCNAENFLIDGDTATIIDFEEIGRTFFAGDIARLMRDFRHEERSKRRQRLDALLEGYATVRPRTGISVEDVSWLLRKTHLEIYAWFYADPANRRQDYMQEWARHLESPLEW